MKTTKVCSKRPLYALTLDDTTDATIDSFCSATLWPAHSVCVLFITILAQCAGCWPNPEFGAKLIGIYFLAAAEYDGISGYAEFLPPPKIRRKKLRPP